MPRSSTTAGRRSRTVDDFGNWIESCLLTSGANRSRGTALLMVEAATAVQTLAAVDRRNGGPRVPG